MEHAQESSPVIAQELQDQLKTLQNLSAINDLIMNAQYPGYVHARIADAVEFIKALHSKCLAEAQAHPDASKVPGLMQAQGE